MISAYNAYKDADYTLKKNGSSLSKEERFTLCKTIMENYTYNRMCWEELEHFQKHKKVLGKNPIFNERVILQKINTMTGEQKHKRLKNLDMGIYRDEKKLKKRINKTERSKIESRLRKKKIEHKLITKALS